MKSKKGQVMGFLIDMIDVGYGDSFLLTLDHPDGGEAYVLIDGGKSDKGNTIVEHLKKFADGHISLVIGTHLDDDHIGGLKAVAESFDIGTFIFNVPGDLSAWLELKEIYEYFGRKAASKRVLIESLETANQLLSILRRKGIKVEEALQGKGWRCGDIILRVLNPNPERINAAWAEEVLESSKVSIIAESFAVRYDSEAPETTASNNAGIIIELEYKGQPYALFTADAGAEVLKEVTEGKSYTFLKIPHHGSKTGLDEELAYQLQPKTAYLPVGENSHGHPATEVLDMLKKVGAQTYCTQKTNYCRKACTYRGFGTLSHKRDKEGHAGWSSAESINCLNNL